MKYFDLKNYRTNTKNLNKKKLVIISIVLLLIIAIIITAAVYISNASFRNILDKYVFRKNITQNHATTIEVNSEDNSHIYAYDKYITILNKNSLKAYSNSGKKEIELEVTINDPLYSANNRFLCIAEKDGQKLCLISGQNITWQKDVEGKITRVNVNKNGYVSVIISGTSYKTIIVTFNPDGKELFKTYLSNTNAIDVDISNDNKYLAIAEIDSSGSMLQSNIKIISMDKAESDPANSIEYMYPASANEIITNIKYQDRNKLSCIYDTSVHIIQDNNDTKLIDISNKKDIFADINLKDNILKVTEKSSGLFADVEVQLTNINSKKENIYTISGVPKSVDCFDTTTAINLGTEVHFIDLNGWLVKKYSSSQEIKDVVLGNSIAGIIYRDKIEIVNL